MTLEIKPQLKNEINNETLIIKSLCKNGLFINLTRYLFFSTYAQDNRFETMHALHTCTSLNSNITWQVVGVGLIICGYQDSWYRGANKNEVSPSSDATSAAATARAVEVILLCNSCA